MDLLQIALDPGVEPVKEPPSRLYSGPALCAAAEKPREPTFGNSVNGNSLSESWHASFVSILRDSFLLKGFLLLKNY